MLAKDRERRLTIGVIVEGCCIECMKRRYHGKADGVEKK
jgi:hypothetical protein